MAKADNGILTVNYHKELDKEMIEWVKSKRNYSAFIRDLIYAAMEQEGNGVIINHPIQKPEIPKSILTSIDNF